MKQVELRIAYVLIILAFQLACEQSQTVKSDINSIDTKNKSENRNQINSNSVSNVEVQKKNVDYFAHLKSEHKEVLQEWLKKKSYLGPATEENDSILVKSDLEYIHKQSKTQFYTVADFNKDGKEDFAVLLIDTRGKKDGERFAIAIFNGDIKKGQSPNYYEDHFEGIGNCYLDYGGMDENYLYLGVYEGDRYAIIYIPKGNTYKNKDLN